MKLLPLLLLITVNAFSQVWSRLPDFPSLKRDDGVAVVVGNKAYFGTGLQEGFSAAGDFFELDLSANTWSQISTMPIYTERQYACAFAGNNCFYVFGGSGYVGALNTLFKYDISSRSWKEMSPKPGGGIIAATCFSFGDKVIIASGRLNGPGSINHEVWEYTISNDTWKQKNNLPIDGRWRASGATLHNFGYLLFGIDTFNVFRKELYRYDHNLDTWTKVTDFPMSKGRAYAAMVGISEKLMVFGGVDSTNTYYNDVWYYNDVLNTWSPETALPAAPRKGGMTCAANGNFYYSCGINASSRLNESWMRDVPLAIKNNSPEPGIQVYPNPAKDVLTVYVPAAERKGKILCLQDVWGSPVLVENLSDVVTTLRLQDLPAGMYILKALSGSTVLYSQKILKEN